MFSTFTSSFQAGRRGSVAYPGSFDFPGTTNSFLRVTNSANFAPGTGDFTIEWWQYLDAFNSYTRPFSIGTYSTGAPLAASFEGADNNNRTMNLWCGSFAGVGVGSIGVVLNTWAHFAIVRESSLVKVYKDGTNITGAGITIPDDIAYDASKYFVIGSESSTGTSSPGNTSVNGRVTNFHFVNGTALYSSDFTRPTGPTVPHANSKLLLKFTSSPTALVDSSGQNTTVSIVGTGSWNNATPF